MRQGQALISSCFFPRRGFDTDDDDEFNDWLDDDPFKVHLIALLWNLLAMMTILTTLLAFRASAQQC